jgi:hypothetical protein
VPTVLQQDFIQDSRKAIKKANRWRNMLFSFVGVLAIVAVILAVFYVFQMKEAEQQKNEALKTQSLFLSDLSRQETFLVPKLRLGMHSPTLRVECSSNTRNGYPFYPIFLVPKLRLGMPSPTLRVECSSNTRNGYPLS